MNMNETIRTLLTPAMLTEARHGQAPVHVYCDVDGVVANFQSAMGDEFGLGDPKSVDRYLRRPESWPSIAKTHPHIFATLQPMSDAKVLMSGLLFMRDRGWIDLSMLTALPEEWMGDPKLLEMGTRDKQQWVVRHFQRMDPSDVIVCRRSEKVRYAIQDHVTNHVASILIDDYKKNIDEWQNQGSGVGILHTSAEQSLLQLRQYLATMGE